MSDQKTENGAVEKADQMAWELPALRPVFTPEGKHETWASPCPAWCIGEHASDEVASKPREHRGEPIAVRLDYLNRYYGEQDGREGIFSGSIALRLVARSRAMQPTVELVSRYGSQGEPRVQKNGTLYFDEVRELISVLQHLMKVGMDS